MDTGELNHKLGITFISATRRSASARPFYGDSLMKALEQHGIPTRVLKPTTKVIPTMRRRAPGNPNTRGLPVSVRFLEGLARSPTPFIGCNEYGLETLLALLIARICGKQALVFQQHVGRAGTPLSPLDIHYRRVIGRLAMAFIANTPAARDEIVEVLRVETARVFQIMIQVPPDRADLSKGHIAVGHPRERPLFLNIGRLIVGKNVEAILGAAKLLRSEGLAFEVWIGGVGPDEARLRRMAKQYNLRDTVRFIGEIPYASVGLVYKTCDVFVQPSHIDYLSNVVLEAMRFGKAVICSEKVGAAGAVAHDRFNALIFDPAKPSELADCMRKFIAEPQLAVDMGRRSAAMMEKHTLDSAAVAIIDVLKRLSAREVRA